MVVWVGGWVGGWIEVYEDQSDGGSDNSELLMLLIELRRRREQAVEHDTKAIEDNLIEQVGLMCDRAVNIHEKNVYGESFCVLKYGVLPYLSKRKPTSGDLD